VGRFCIRRRSACSQFVQLWVDFNFNAHRPLQLRRVSFSVRNQLPMRPVSGCVNAETVPS
jgi:hypothetical protein